MDLSLVLPVFNEPGIERVVREAADLVEQLAPGAGEVVVVDDASTDQTPGTLDRLNSEIPALVVLHKEVNGGHGPALLDGFALARGAWIAHLDTDDQIPTTELARLWSERDGADLVLGHRATRHDPRHRLILTVLTRGVVRLAAGASVADANVPCKLFTRDLWSEARSLMPPDTFAPSLGLVVVAARRGRRIRTLEVQHRARTEGETTLRPARLARAIVVSFRQTLGVALRCR